MTAPGNNIQARMGMLRPLVSAYRSVNKTPINYFVPAAAAGVGLGAGLSNLISEDSEPIGRTALNMLGAAGAAAAAAYGSRNAGARIADVSRAARYENLLDRLTASEAQLPQALKNQEAINRGVNLGRLVTAASPVGAFVAGLAGQKMGDLASDGLNIPRTEAVNPNEYASGNSDENLMSYYAAISDPVLKAQVVSSQSYYA